MRFILSLPFLSLMVFSTKCLIVLANRSSKSLAFFVTTTTNHQGTPSKKGVKDNAAVRVFRPPVFASQHQRYYLSRSSQKPLKATTPDNDNDDGYNDGGAIKQTKQEEFSSRSSSNNNSNNNSPKQLYATTPLIFSAPMTALCKNNKFKVFLKLDALQPSGSFKDRGMAHLCQNLLDHNVTKLISSSGGNAGLAVATVGACLEKLSVSVVVPTTTKDLVVQKLKALGAHVTIYGENWNQADGLARQWVRDDPKGGAAYISPYDNPLLWTGHSTVVDEIMTSLQEEGQQQQLSLRTIVASVGGGGLLCGIFEGLKRWDTTTRVVGSNNDNASSNVKVVATETEGAASFHAAWIKERDGSRNGGGPVRLESIDSIATSLGALEVAPEVLKRAKHHVERGGQVQSLTCTDKEAVEACLKFAQDHRILVEPACGAALAAVYSDRLRDKLLEYDGDDCDGDEKAEGAIVIEVCGGSGVNVELLEMWRNQYL